MKILYIARHDQAHSNDDEGAITRALEVLGHTVERVREQKGYKSTKMRPDLLLFHKWDDVASLRQFKDICPRVFWYFDLVDWPSDPTLAPRSAARREWMARIIPEVELGFCTDGDWVADDKLGKLIWLAQGADERVVGRGHCQWESGAPEILFTGISARGGVGRESFVSEMKERYGKRFLHVPSGTYREKLREVISLVKIVVAPDSPVTDRYWSNRVYNALGFGAFLLHPWCTKLQDHYMHDTDIVYYTNREELHTMIDFYCRHQNFRSETSNGGFERTISQHLYRHRVEELLRTVKERT